MPPSTDAETRDLVESLAGLDAAGDPEGYVATHRSVTARIRELDPTHYNGLYPQALGRLLDGTEGIDELRYLRLAHENREGATMKTLYEVGPSIEKLLETSVSAQAASTSSTTKPCFHKHPRFSNHDWDHCDQNPDMKNPSGRDMRRRQLLERKKSQQAKRQEVVAKAAVEAVLALQTQAATSPTRNYSEANGDNIGDLDSKVYATIARIVGNVNQNSEYTTGHPPERSVNYLIDSGASKHMFPASVPMRNISKCHVPIRLADNSTRQAIATGTVAQRTGSPVVPIFDDSGPWISACPTLSI
jgi:hypothetical protein